jgi:hypothetical protein
LPDKKIGLFFCNNPSSDCLLLEILFSSRRSARITIREFHLDSTFGRNSTPTKSRIWRFTFIGPVAGRIWKAHGDPNDHDARCRADVGRSRVTRLTGSPLLLGSRKEGYKRFSNTAPSHRTNIDANVTLREI